MPEHTPRMLTKQDLEVMTEAKAQELGRQSVAALSAQLGVDEAEQMCVIQWGKQAFREGEPAQLTGQYTMTNPHKRGQKGFYAVVKYADGCPNYVNMALPQYPRGKKPPWFFTRRPYEEVRDEHGAVVERPGKPQRPADWEHWLEFVPRKACRKALKVIE